MDGIIPVISGLLYISASLHLYSPYSTPESGFDFEFGVGERINQFMATLQPTRARADYDYLIKLLLCALDCLVGVEEHSTSL
ncbi:hypothetical protein C1H46_043362 [Malus baccata]|uniref:Uncharacterized protein n=1 Tax=Malus baccata TaxID=106549 RepID=A0A540KA41_MALBA|nr:hypothetical protein C1H46_043362 [Malus baccata]